MTLSCSWNDFSCFRQDSRLIPVATPIAALRSAAVAPRGGYPPPDGRSRARGRPLVSESGAKDGALVRPERRVERLADRARDPRLAGDVPEAVREAKRHLGPLRAVVVEVMALDVLEVPTLELAEVHRVVDPLLDDVRLDEAREECR